MTQIKATWALAKHDLLMWRRMPMAIACALIPPVGMGLLIIVLTLTVTMQPVALVTQAHGAEANRMASLVRSDKEAYALTETGPVNAAAMLRDQQVTAVITIPPGFDRGVSENSARLELTLNNIDIDFSDDIRRSVERSAGQFDGLQLGPGAQDDPAPAADTAPSKSIEGEKVSDEPGVDDMAAAVPLDVPNAYHIGITEHDLRVTNVDFLHYQVLPVLILFLLNVGLLGTSMFCAADVERGTARLLTLAPVSAATLVAGRLLGGFISSLAVLAVGLALCIAVHAISPPSDHWPILIALFVCTALCSAGLGAVLGSVMHGTRNIAMASTLLATYMFFMGGGFTTIAFLPRFIRGISAADPMRYAIDGMRQALFYRDLRGVGLDLAVLTCTAVGSVMVGSVMVVRSWRS